MLMYSHRSLMAIHPALFSRHSLLVRDWPHMQAFLLFPLNPIAFKDPLALAYVCRLKKSRSGFDSLSDLSHEYYVLTKKH